MEKGYLKDTQGLIFNFCDGLTALKNENVWFKSVLSDCENSDTFAEYCLKMAESLNAFNFNLGSFYLNAEYQIENANDKVKCRINLFISDVGIDSAGGLYIREKRKLGSYFFSIEHNNKAKALAWAYFIINKFVAAIQNENIVRGLK